MVKYSNQVHTTTDYFMFKSIDGNRNKNLMHINRLKKSMSDNYLFTIITVNENYEIIDGQHRFEVIKELKLPLNYVVCNGYGLNEVHILNANAKTWNSDDYLEGYCNLGYKEYLMYKKFKEKYNFCHNVCQLLLTGNDAGSTVKEFHSGVLKINNYNNACLYAEKLNKIGNYYDGYKRNTFIRALYSLMKNPVFNFDEFINKLENTPMTLKDSNTVQGYKLIIEEIYNYRRREKVSLRY